jgi:hypothetical protein
MTLRAALVSLLAVATCGINAVGTPLVTGLTPTTGPEGTKIQVGGSGFAGTTNVLFVPMSDAVPVSFSVVDDSHLEVFAPKYTESGLLQLGFGIVVQAGTTATLALANAEQVTTDVTYEGNEHHYHVLSGGKVTGGGGSVVGFVEAGGTYDFGGGGTSFFFVKDGGTLDWSVGGSSLVFAEPSAILHGPLVPPNPVVPANLVPLTDLTLSVVGRNYHYPVPEPSTWLLATLAGIGLLAFRRRR